MGRVIKLFIYFFAYQFVAGAIMMGSYMIVNHTVDIPDAELFMKDHLLWIQLLYALLLTAHLLGWKYVKRSDFNLDFPNAKKVLLTSVVFIIGMGCWTNYLTELTELPDRFADEFRMLMNHPIGVFSIVIMAPLMEELLVRGGMQGHLMRKWKNPMWAIVVSSLIFGLIHGNPVQIFFAFLSGLALGWIYYRTGSLLPGILMHFINNGTSVLLFHLSGGKDETRTEALGTTGAVCLALVGVALTVWSIWYIKTRLIPNQIAWKETPALAEEVIVSEDKEQA